MSWKSISYDDITWKTGSGQFGYGEGDEKTVIGYGPDQNNKYITSYFRKKFQVADTTGTNSLMLRLLADAVP
jgi:hypothetical protein